MVRPIPLLILLVLAAPVPARSADSDAVQQERYSLKTLTKYCNSVEDLSNSQQPLVFAQTFPDFGPSFGWVELSGIGAWKRAGKPLPLALVWYREDRIVRVAITAKNGSPDGFYTDYCYRPDGSLARMRSVPGTQNACDPSLFHFSFTFRAERLYPPKSDFARQSSRPISPFKDQSGILPYLFRPLPSEKTTFIFAPTDWPEYLTVRDLPFPLPATQKNLARYP